jgi:hypothetical protein
MATEPSQSKQSNDQPAFNAYYNSTNYPLDPQIRMPHVELPNFHSDGVRAWILEVEDTFKLVRITGESRLRWGIAHIRGQAKIWLNSLEIDLQTTTWAELC